MKTSLLLLAAGCFLSVSAEILTVTSSADSGPNTLRYFAENPTVPNEDIIQFAPDIHYIQLASPIAISYGLTIQGPGWDELEISAASGAYPDGLFDIDTSANGGHPVTFKDIVIKNFSTDDLSSAIDAESPLVLDHTIITNSQNTTYFGRGVNAKDDLNITDSKITLCTFDGKGGGIRAGAFGGKQNSVMILNSEIAYNKTVDEASGTQSGGGLSAMAWSDSGMTVTIENSTIHGNEATPGTHNTEGGGLKFYNATVTLRDVNVTDNRAVFGGGIDIYSDSGHMFTMENCLISGNVAEDNTTRGAGGGIYNLGADLRISGSIVKDNRALDNGGGIYASAYSVTYSGLSLEESTVQENNATGSGGGIYINENVNAYINRSLILGNIASEHGGGLTFANNTDQLSSMMNSTFSGNRADGKGGAIYLADVPTPYSIGIKFTTVTDNTADADNDGLDSGSGVYAPGGFVIAYSLVAGNHLGSGANEDIDGSFTVAQGYNLIGVNGGTGFTDGVNNDIVGTIASPVDPKIGPLADNGGPTMTHALLSGSPAIDAAGTKGLGYPSVDQRDFPRPQNNLYDIGAFELKYSPTTIVPMYYLLFN